LAVEFGKTEVVKLLLSKDADVNALNEYKATPLHLATKLATVEIAKVLLENGANVNARDEHQRTPLYMAVEANKMEVSKLFLEKGADVTLKGGIGEQLTPLMLAEKKKFFELAEILRK